MLGLGVGLTSPAGLGGSGDILAPALSNADDDAAGTQVADLAVDTTEANGTLYWVVTTSSTPPSKAQVKAGQSSSGAAAAASGSQAVSASGTQTITGGASGLTANSSYTAHFMHEDAAGNQSNVASGDGFTTAVSLLAYSIVSSQGAVDFSESDRDALVSILDTDLTVAVI